MLLLRQHSCFPQGSRGGFSGAQEGRRARAEGTLLPDSSAHRSSARGIVRLPLLPHTPLVTDWSARTARVACPGAPGQPVALGTGTLSPTRLLKVWL